VAELARFLEFDVSGDVAGATAVVVAGLGHDEETSIRAALDAGVGYIALVASPRRGPQVLDGMGLTSAERARIHTPAGAWIGARTPPEIALSIMADIVKAIRLDGLSATPFEKPAAATDPICGMTVLITPDALTDGDGHYFCGPGCLARFTGA